ncbi:hypothetical protein EMCG_04836 [[Emmonsia] crescens]|uniref:Retrovirus-related Pol polyprotein from transposon TNT 1-94-like beta-barrel domain-containing protein n=1 Tax=[Emmonsia] crescens TaxID=73230 RepID=A0A0G2IYE1_9EURO|nr:hypothetical protein EMCG_04836 [Emmonsia crescens UAMH 3008]
MASAAEEVILPTLYTKPRTSKLTIWDTGAGCHLVHSKNSFVSLYKIEKGPTIRVANKAILDVIGIGVAAIAVGEKRFTFHSAYYAPGLSANLIYYGLLSKQGYSRKKMKGEGGDFFEMISPNGEDIVYANLTRHNIYAISDTPPQRTDFSSSNAGYMAYLADPKSFTKSTEISTSYDPQTASLGPSNKDEIEQL